MRSTSTADSARWHPWQVAPTSRAIATPPNWDRSSSYSGHRSSGTGRPLPRARARHGQIDLDGGFGLGHGGGHLLGLALEPLALGLQRGELGVHRLGQLHDLELLVLDLADAPADRGDVVLQGLQLAGVADRPRVQLLLRLVGPLGERRHLVLEPLLAARELAPALVDGGEPAVELCDLLVDGDQLRPLGQRVEAARQLVDAGVVGLDGE